MLFLLKANSPARLQLDSNPQYAVHETKSLSSVVCPMFQFAQMFLLSFYFWINFVFLHHILLKLLHNLTVWYLHMSEILWFGVGNDMLSVRTLLQQICFCSLTYVDLIGLP